MLNNCLKTIIAPTVKAIMPNKRQMRDPPLKKHHLQNNDTLSKAATSGPKVKSLHYFYFSFSFIKVKIPALIMEHLLKKGYKERSLSFS
ncbi:hypothetical protein LXL04_028760 [Taraxacum kok-saghyz]